MASFPFDAAIFETEILVDGAAVVFVVDDAPAPGLFIPDAMPTLAVTLDDLPAGVGV